MSGLLFILSAPSGAGKTTVCDALLEKTDNLKKAITSTTRPPRPGEEDGVDYFFLSKDQFRKRIAERRFLEHAVIYDNYYGSGRDYIESQLEAGYDVILVVDAQGARSIRKTGIAAVYIFLLPPSLEELRARLIGRQSDSPEVIEKRFSRAREELGSYAEYDYCVINDDLGAAVADIQAVMRAERCRVRQCPEIVKKIMETYEGV
ncbi:MAG: guanylate kinase [PVC group bacterium]